MIKFNKITCDLRDTSLCVSLEDAGLLSVTSRNGKSYALFPRMYPFREVKLFPEIGFKGKYLLYPIEVNWFSLIL